ncbi:translation factor SUA5 [Sulfobacillus thermosulfidooxidans DSM 9293]|uniref:Threonylcarbamoyl-AMP synthase n=2 Tax=Sulfobacillus thermosulfidooxidans TaxID=28034 RepID=A0A1W1WG67_SULTA|nr:L-threonylcarbamoyladenylate synthase [Sulfobacillus thermosulfidooxidans]PSR24566.1 MAG: threonylcarbamoyl-AMP synthase [Sulfobacillus thermosulfidooxidans]SMC05182.1 translation factor SUA5 [Sulfobacillus thermosulfidooxidans DSM 9293]
MQTVMLTADQLDQAIAALKQGEVVAFPTETVYGLGADATNEQACQKIFQAKGRPADNPLIVHVLDQDGLEAVTGGRVPSTARILVEKFWPGPLTVVVASNDKIPLSVRGGMPTVAVRAPSHPIARKLIEGLGRPIAAPSANRSGRPSPTRALDVFHDLQGRVPFIIDGGESFVGLESTIVDCSLPEPVLLRPGFIGLETLESVLGQRVLLPGAHTPHKAPGMKYRHYAPQAPVIWINMREDRRIEETLSHLKQEFDPVALLAPQKWQDYPVSFFRVLGEGVDEVAHELFTGFRELDNKKPGAIVVIWPEDDSGVGLAIANRLGKAASRQVKE